MCRYCGFCRELSNEYLISYLLPKIGVDTAENEPSKVSNFVSTQAISPAGDSDGAAQIGFDAAQRAAVRAAKNRQRYDGRNFRRSLRTSQIRRTFTAKSKTFFAPTLPQLWGKISRRHETLLEILKCLKNASSKLKY